MSYSGYGLLHLLKDKKELIGLEIGVNSGWNAEFLLSNLNISKLYGIDPYIEYIDWNNLKVCHTEDNSEQIAESRLGKYSNFIKCKKTSDDAINDFQNEMFDFIFIDGLHTYDQVLKDCKNYYSKLKIGGIFSGHDYTLINDVHQAVNQYALEINKNVMTMPSDSWYWVK